MTFFYKSIIYFILLIFTIVSVSPLFFACYSEEEDGLYAFDGLIVDYLDVGEGDATFIRLPDGKTMLIDTALNTNKNKNKLFSTIKKYGNSIDYLVLSHPDEEHIGNAKNIINEFKIGKAFVPYLLNGDVYPEMYEIINLLKMKEVVTKVSITYTNLSSDDYTLIFLYPDFYGEDANYNEFNATVIPSETLADDVSPLIYLEYNGVRFLFSADAGAKVENHVLTWYKMGLYDKALNDGKKVNLKDIDFYKLSSHGGSRGNSKEFLALLSPKNAVISVGVFNGKGHPSTEVLYNLYEVNNDYKLFRTDRDKTISVCVSKEGELAIYKGK